MEIFFTSDLHIDHRNMLKYSTMRGYMFENVDQMNEGIIRNWNRIITPKDIVFHLGDLSLNNNYTRLSSFLKRLNGLIIQINGNHDRESTINKLEQDGIIKTLDNDSVITHQNQKIVLSHYPKNEWKGINEGWWHFHGHSHGTLGYNNQKRIDVGIDNHPLFQPFSYSEIEEKFMGM